MGYDPVTGVATFGAYCQPGMVAIRDYLAAKFSTGDLGCYNPASKAGGGPSLHAEGRAQDFALDATNPEERERGDALLAWVVLHADALGAQEVLWRDYIWTWKHRSEGIRSPSGQGPAHQSHVHLGVDVDAALHWTPDRLKIDSPPMREETLFVAIVKSNTGALTAWLVDGGFVIRQFTGPAGAFGIPQSAIDYSGGQLLVRSFTVDELAAAQVRTENAEHPPVAPPGLTADQVTQIVRGELDKTTLTGGP